MQVEIFSDVICPWCYLGRRRFQRALEQLPFAAEVDVRWRAYQLDPRAPTESQDLRRALERKYGPGSYDAMTRRLSALGAAEGIDYRWDLAKRVNTFDAHRLVCWAEDVGGAAAQDRLTERLFRAYFTEGVHVADHGELARLAGEVGLDAAEASEVLGSEGFADRVRGEIDRARELDVTGVPAFVIEGSWVVPGAQEPETFASLLTRLHGKGKGSAAVTR